MEINKQISFDGEEELLTSISKPNYQLTVNIKPELRVNT